ncbi:hypothetical protein EE091_10070 [Staphylococcus aureus]|nr:hypothetical protein EE091_10070 [Staphylococcus aureus]
MQVGGAPTQRISKRNSTGNASWGGAPTQKLTKSQLTIMCRLGTIKKYFFFITLCPTHFPKY